MTQDIRPRPPQARGELVPHDHELFEVVIKWSPYDVIEVFGDLGIDKTLAEAEEWLQDRANRFKGVATELGYAVLREIAEETE